jgi:hypothetical protein
VADLLASPDQRKEVRDRHVAHLFRQKTIDDAVVRRADFLVENVAVPVLRGDDGVRSRISRIENFLSFDLVHVSLIGASKQNLRGVN